MKQWRHFNQKMTIWGIVFAFCLLAIAHPAPALKKLMHLITPDIVLAALPPVITVTSPADGLATNNSAVEVTGITEPGVAVAVYLNDSLQGSVLSDTAGEWNMPLGPLPEGIHSLYAMAADTEGNSSISNMVTFEVDSTPPELNITGPEDGGYTNRPVVEGQTDPDITVAVHVYGGGSGTVMSDGTGKWFYLDGNLEEGSYSAYAVATDRAGNSTVSGTVSFILDMSRPMVIPDIYPAEDMTRVAMDVVTRVYIIDNSPLDPANLNSALVLFEENGAVWSSVAETVYNNIYGSTVGSVAGTVNHAVYTTVYGDPYYEFSFKPDAPLKPGVKYSASVNPLMSDAAGNYINPRTWSFTTWGAGTGENPHGNYLSNVNVCANCHTPHRAGASRLVEPRDTQYTDIDEYCNACHDGTAAPVPYSWQSMYRHDFKVSIEGVAGISSCTACHTPHVAWTKENPNLLQDYYIFDHNDPTNPFFPDSSEQEMCELCHPGTIVEDPRVQYIRYTYEKWHTSTGASSDYSLCLGCHDGGNALNIASYYGGPSRHSLKAADGSYLDGGLPCSDCHNTHGSQNLKLLKEQLGHNSTQLFRTENLIWDAATERRFCTGCHNNTTELYGITAGFVYAIPGHEETSKEPCSSCHGGSPAAAAHAPQ